jgi:hypothetical protein
MDHAIQDLAGRSFRIIIHNGKDGILQSNLCKELQITSRDGSRLALRLEKQSLIRREKILENGRWTYKLLPIELPLHIETIDKAPCLTCPVEHMCCVDGSYSPNSCNLIQDWLISSFDSSSRQQYHAKVRQNKRHQEISLEQRKPSAKRDQKRALKNNKK